MNVFDKVLSRSLCRDQEPMSLNVPPAQKLALQNKRGTVEKNLTSQLTPDVTIYLFQPANIKRGIYSKSL